MNTYAADLHTHTIASGHAYSTIKEMAIAAEEKGIRLLGITEHSKGMPGSCQDIYFSNLRVVDRKIGEVALAMGVELNIIDYDGNGPFFIETDGYRHRQYAWPMYSPGNKSGKYKCLY